MHRVEALIVDHPQMPCVGRGYRLATAAPRLDQPQRLRAHEDLRVVPLAPIEWRDVTVLAKRSAPVSFLEASPDGRADVRVGTPVQQEAREARFVRLALAVVDPE